MKNLYKMFKIEFSTNRVYGLDILRAVAVLIIVLGHGNGFLPVSVIKIINYLSIDGVTIFFVLSGFLIGGILIKLLEQEKHGFLELRRFWVRRWLRTLPLYFMVLLLLICLNHLFNSGFKLRETIPFFFFCQNFYKSASSFFVVSWSLSIEEWFYFLVPLLIFLLLSLVKLTPRRAILSTAVCIILYAVVYRFYRYSTINLTTVDVFDNFFRRPVLTRMDSLVFGVMGAWLFYYYKMWWIKNKNVFFATGLSLFVLIIIATNTILKNAAFYYCNVAFMAESLGTLLLLPFLSSLRTGKGIVYKSITYISLISYSVYLLHAQIVKDWMLMKVSIPGINYQASMVIKYFLYWILTIGLSILSFKYIEQPFIKIRDKKK